MGCASGPRIIPVKEYQAQAAAVENAPQSKELLKEISRLSDVTCNSVFTEESGLAEYIIGPGDVLELTFWKISQPLKYETTVRSDGYISYSFLDDVRVAGLTRPQIDEVLTQGLAKYIKNVRIDVTVLKYQSKSALLFGEINIMEGAQSGPGKYMLKGKTSILDLIVMAGGATKDSDLKNVELVRKGMHYRLNLYDAMFKGDMSQNVIIDDGDMVTIPELPELAERVYVFGEVNTEGIYPHEESYDLLAALSRAGGCTETAVESSIKIIRGYGKGEPVVLSASLDDILDRGDISQNIRLIDGDVIYVPRTIIGDVNKFIVNSTPLLDYLFYPARYRDSYSFTERMRYFMPK